MYFADGRPSTTNLGRSYSSFSPMTNNCSVQADVKIVNQTSGSFHGIEGRGEDTQNTYAFVIYSGWHGVSKQDWVFARMTGVRTWIIIAQGQSPTVVANR